MYRALCCLNTTIDFLDRQVTYQRHYDAVGAAHKIIDVSPPAPCPRLKLYRWQVGIHRARVVEHERGLFAQIQRGERARTEARRAFPQEPIRYTDHSRNWASSLGEVEADLRRVRPATIQKAARRSKESRQTGRRDGRH